MTHPLHESYVAEVSWLFRYLTEKPFDVRTYIYEIMAYLEHDDGWHEAVDGIIGPAYTLASVLETWNNDPSAVYSDDRLMDALQDAFNRTSDSLRDAVVQDILSDDPADAPTWAHIELYETPRLLPRETWLIHFSDNAEEIADKGFEFGTQDMEKLGLTTWSHKEAKKFGGYNFAYRALEDQHHFKSKQLYGDHAVLFQSSGVTGWHSGDNEPQTIFWGPAVRPQDIVYLHGSGSGWAVRANDRAPAKRSSYFTSDDITACIDWVVTNHRQYKRMITRPDVVQRIDRLVRAK